MKFKIGDMVWLVAAKPEYSYSIGYEYEVLGYYTDGRVIIFNPNDLCEYIEKGLQKGSWRASETDLKLIKPPEEASWDQIQKSLGWNPTKEVAHN
jgi:gamma-glutamylcysteine synthetase